MGRILEEALESLDHAVESTSGEHQQPRNLIALADRVRQALVERGVAPNEPVHLRIGNKPSDLGALLGIWQVGAVAVPVHALSASATLERGQRLSRARFLIDGDQVEILGSQAPPDRALLRGAALVIFTSGSTGEPKGVVVGHGQLADKLSVLDRLLGIRTDDVVLCPLRLTFIFGLWVALLTLMKGARLVLVPKFTSDAIGRSLLGATVLAGVPSMFRTLLAASAPPALGLRLILTGGEVLAPSLAGALRRLTPAAIHDLYGLTETGSCDFCLGPADQPQGSGTIGVPTERVAFRLARDGRAVAAGEIGELQILTPFGMLGYL
ncbi:MAG: class I adenylate-forming enzyme family protein, partial [Terriglobia bacterium]